MKLVPYTNEDSTDLLKIMEKHIDFTPEIETSENEKANFDYVHEMCTEVQSEALSYLLKLDDGEIVGYLSACSHEGNQSTMYMRITFLLIKQNDRSNHWAEMMVDQFSHLLHEAKAMCVNVHPNRKMAIEFWRHMGFVHMPEMSEFTNADNQRLFAYWKFLR